MDLDKALNDLNAERQWLDSVIGALEIASASPAHRLVRSLDQTLWPGGRSGGMRLGPRKRTELSKLAQLVRKRCRNASRGRAAS